jgi:hypothetical protein
MACIKNSNYTEIGRRLREIPLEAHISSHEWEELVQKLCASDDSSLHEIGIKELGKLNHIQTIINEK